LNSSVLIISQRMKSFARNEKILGRNILVLNKKITLLKERLASSPEIATVPDAEGSDTQNSESVLDSENETSSALTAVLKAFEELKKNFTELQANAVSKEKFAEFEFLMTTVDPLKFATLDQVEELIDKKLGKKKK
ncbi:MAG: hypothetical protein Q7K42_05450, partial [Candidatus Diapherotrites archaeon]|nr:hypothetical protein [Candidatus Diapherotrites archaeon]